MATPAMRPDGRAFLVEHYWPNATVAEYEDAMARVGVAVAEMAANGAPIRLLHSTFVPGDEAALSVLVANTSAEVEAAYQAAGVRCDRIIEAVDSGND